VQRNSDWARRERSKLYRFVELIGYWSMLDVLGSPWSRRW
jgi:paraquat-inducible protein A